MKVFTIQNCIILKKYAQGSVEIITFMLYYIYNKYNIKEKAMLLTIDFESNIPLYMQLKNQIIEGIAMGQLKSGESLPSVRQMAEDIGINLHTVNKAYNLLKHDGFLIIDRRKGAMVNLSESMKNEFYINNLFEELRPIVAEAYCRGMTEEEIKSLCGKIYNFYNGEGGVL